MSRFNEYLESVQKQYPTLEVIHLKDKSHKDGQQGWEILSAGQVQFYIWKKPDGSLEITDEGGSDVSDKHKQKLINHPLIKEKLGL